MITFFRILWTAACCYVVYLLAQGIIYTLDNPWKLKVDKVIRVIIYGMFLAAFIAFFVALFTL